MSNQGKFRPRGCVVEALSWTGSNVEALQALTDQRFAVLGSRAGKFRAVLYMVDKLVPVRQGDIIVKTAAGLLEVMAEEPFQTKYEPCW